MIQLCALELSALYAVARPMFCFQCRAPFSPDKIFLPNCRRFLWFPRSELIMKFLLNVVLLTVLVACVNATINPSKTKKAKQKTSAEVNVKINKGPQERSVYERNLVDHEPLASEIIAEAHTYYKDTSLKNFNGSLLGYVTPVRPRNPSKCS